MLEIYLQVSQGRSAKARAKDIFDSLDKDGDGELTMNEFVDGYLVMMVDSWKVPGIEKRGTPELQLTRWTRLLIRVQPTVNFVPDRTTFVSVTRVTNLDKNCIRNSATGRVVYMTRSCKGFWSQSTLHCFTNNFHRHCGGHTRHYKIDIFWNHIYKLSINAWIQNEPFYV